MVNIEYIEVGRVIRSQGIQGELVVEMSINIKNDVHLVYIDLNDEGINMGEGESKVAYTVSSIRFKNDKTAIIRFMEISGRAQTRFLEGKTLYVAKEDCFPDTYINDEINNRLSGYKIYDQHEKKQLGKIIGLKKVRSRKKERTLIVVEYDNQELPVPYEQDIIQSIDHNEKVVYVNMPFEFLEVLLH